MNDIANLPAPENRWFEDYPAGAVYEFGRVEVDEADLIAFSERYDPQPFHIDREAAAQHYYGGIIASGWHTAALMMRPMVDHFLPTRSGLGSPGVDELKWIKPVRPGDVLRGRMTILSARVSGSNPSRGVIHTLYETLNQKDEVVMSMKAIMLLRRRPTEGAPA